VVKVKQYSVNEIFYSIQGEGANAGAPAIFIRFAGCNLQCTKATVGWDCDTDHRCRQTYTMGEIAHICADLAAGLRHKPMVVLTGGEPFVQLGGSAMVADPLIDALRCRGFGRIAAETNGTLGHFLWPDWVCVSPKPGTEVLQKTADEVKIVLADGQPIPECDIAASHYFLSPAWASVGMDGKAVAWCVKQVKENPQWKLSLQTHKLIGVP